MGTSHIVVDGSNIATEGRSLPSLQQLLEAVDAVAVDQKPDAVTVIVDATFGHRIDKDEREAYDAKVSNGEIITPPAGVIGRGDAFILEVANRADAVVLSNDSFQEFHGEYRWLFDEGRLLGGKHVPGVGWIFLDRSPVRGPASRKATSDAKRKRKAASEGPQKSTKGPAKKRTANKKADSKGQQGRSRGQSKNQSESKSASKGKDPDRYNDLLPFVNFVGANEVGSVVQGEIEQFSSHGAYVMVGETRCYIALKSLGDPPPRSARDVLAQGETRSFRVDAIDTPRRGIDLSLADGPVIPPATPPEEHERDEAITADSSEVAAAIVEPVEAPAVLITQADLEDPGLSVSQRRKLRGAFAAQEAAAQAVAAAPVGETPKQSSSTQETPAMATSKPTKPATGRAPRKGAAKKAATPKRASAKKAVPKKAAAKKAPAKKATAKKATAKKATAAKRSGATKAAPKKAPAKKAPAKKSVSKSVARKAPAKKATATKSAAKRSAAKKAAPKKASAKKAAPKKAATKKAGAKKAATKRSPAKRA